MSLSDDSLNKVNEEDKKVRYAILKVFGIVALGVTGIATLVAGVGLALGAFGISMGIPLVGSALVTAGSWLATAIPALGAFGVALPIALGAIGGFGIAALVIFGIYKLVKSLSKRPILSPSGQINEKDNNNDNINNGEVKNKNLDNIINNNNSNKNKIKNTLDIDIINNNIINNGEVKNKNLDNIINNNNSNKNKIKNTLDIDIINNNIINNINSVNLPRCYPSCYPKEQHLNINALGYIPTENIHTHEVTALTMYKPNVIDVKEQTGTSISNNIYDPTGLMYNLFNIIVQNKLHEDILTSEPHLKAPMRSDFSKLFSIQIWNNEDISTKLENANRHHSIGQIVPIAIMSSKYKFGTSKVYFQICIDPTSRSFNLLSCIVSLTDKNIFTLSWHTVSIMYDSEKSFASLSDTISESDTISDTILKLLATSNVSEYDAKNGNVVNVIKNSLTHENKEMISNQIAIDKGKDGFQLYVNLIRRFFGFQFRNITNTQLDTSDINLNINAQKYIPTENRRKNEVTSLTAYKPNVIDVKEQTGTSISNNIYDPTGLMYNLFNIIVQNKLHEDILTSEPHLKAPMRSDFSKLFSIQIWNNEDISTKLENANRHHSIGQIVPIAIMSSKYKFGTSKVYFQICIDPTSRSFNLLSCIVSLTDKNIFTLSWHTVSIMYDSEKSFASLSDTISESDTISDTILKLLATSNVSEYDAKNGNVVNVIKNSLTHENKEMISNQIATDKVKDSFQLDVNPIRSFSDFQFRNITNIHSDIIGIKWTKKTILQLSNNDESKIKVNTGENKIEINKNENEKEKIKIIKEKKEGENENININNIINNNDINIKKEEEKKEEKKINEENVFKGISGMAKGKKYQKVYMSKNVGEKLKNREEVDHSHKEKKDDNLFSKPTNITRNTKFTTTKKCIVIHLDKPKMNTDPIEKNK